MPRIVLTMNGVVLRELTLSNKRITIGRRPQNDLVIDSLAVSGEHAAIVLVDNEAILEDLNSTNGTQVNGQPIKRHFLQDNDVVELAQYCLTYCADPHAAVGQGTDHLLPPDETKKRTGAIRILNGVGAGMTTPLTKALTTIGRPGVQVAVIAQRPDGFYVSHVEGASYPTINGTSMAVHGYRLKQGDVIGLIGAQIEFLSP